MKYIYSFSIQMYALLVRFASLFNRKAKLRYEGVKKSFDLLANFKSEKLIWLHCASLGEFEQARTLIETFKMQKPDYKLALSFYSPSGYEVQTEYEHADIVFYLPNDTKKNAKKLIKLLNPNIVFFIKYEFWHWYLKELKFNNIPCYLVSGIFREKQLFFKFYGSFYRNILKNFTTLFVQNEGSKQLLEGIGIKNVIITGDTRFDRVYEISRNKTEFPLIKEFVSKNLVFIAGSTWNKDEEIIFDYINNNTAKGIKFIIAPHEIKPENIQRIKKLSLRKTVLFSQANNKNIQSANVLIIDNIGMLSSLYFYADIAYIGGGFGAGIHNTLEAAVFGIPLIFGNNYYKFEEAKELIKRESAFAINNKYEFNEFLNKLINDKEYRNSAGKKSLMYIKENIGATNKILEIINL